MSTAGVSSVGVSTRIGSGAEAAIRIGISTCLLGEPVRFDGGHKRDPFLVETEPHPRELMLRNHV